MKNFELDPKMRVYALRALACEKEVSAGATSVEPETARVFEALRRSLTNLIGTIGFRALLARAVTLARQESPSLHQLRVGADGSLEGLREHYISEGADPSVAVIAHLLGLLETFIGEALMLHVLFDIWPNCAMSNQSQSKGLEYDSAE